MASQMQEPQRLFQAAVSALQGGRGDEARRHAEALVALAPGNAAAQLLLATACRGQGDAAAEEAALDRLLAIEPRSARGLIMKGDCRARAGDEKGASGAYRVALMVAEGQEHPPQMIEELRRAEAAMQRFKARYASELEAALSGEGFVERTRSPRFQRSLDIMAGRSQAFFQQPTGYYFPELPQRQYFEREEFGWAAAVEAATGAIRAEIEAFVAARGAGFRPYILSDPNKPRADDNPLLDNADWSALFLCENGAVDEGLKARFPETWASMQHAPLPHVDGMGPTIMFSLLRPGARINAHTGVFNTRLTCHLPLIVPPGCGFRVGNEVREWQPGELLVFDDTIEHEAWNEGSADRIVLIFDIWRPELSEQERREVGALLAFSRPREE